MSVLVNRNSVIFRLEEILFLCSNMQHFPQYYDTRTLPNFPCIAISPISICFPFSYVPYVAIFQFQYPEFSSILQYKKLNLIYRHSFKVRLSGIFPNIIIVKFPLMFSQTYFLCYCSDVWCGFLISS